MGGRLAFVVVLGIGCGAPVVPVVEKDVVVEKAPVVVEKQPEPVRVVAAVEDGFEAVVRIDEKPGGKKFQGVWLERADGERWVVAYRPEPWLVAFAGRAVRVTGETYVPPGQAIHATHFKLGTLRVVDMRGGIGPLFAVGPEMTMAGKFVQAKGEGGSKSEGSTWWTLVAADGASYEVDGLAEGKPTEGAATVVARELVPDASYAARRLVSLLWVVKVEKP